MAVPRKEISLETYLPRYLKNDITALEEGIKNNSSLLDCLYDEVQGSINSAYYDNQITEDVADYLRGKYCQYKGHN